MRAVTPGVSLCIKKRALSHLQSIVVWVPQEFIY